MIVVQRIRPDRAEGFCGKPLWAEERERGRATMPSDLAWYGPALLNWSTWLLICIHHQVRCFQVHHSAFSTVPGARIIATQSRKEHGGYWASKWPSGLVTHLVCLINAHVMKLRRGKKLHGVVIMLKIFATRQYNECFFFSNFPHTINFKTLFTDVTKP